MATIAFMHAHPDDEAIATGGTMALLADAGHEVILITATDGAVGEVEEGFLAGGETLAEVRERETREAAVILGVSELILLGYRDSGMMGTPTNDDPDCFWQADVEQASADLAARLSSLGVDVLAVYDEIGGYGHPDHIQVHRVGHRAAELAQIPKVYESTINRDRVAELVAAAAEQAAADGADLDLPDRDDISELGTPDAAITTAIDVVPVLDRKRRAMRAHASQIGEDSWFFTMPPESFERTFGTEWYVQTTPPPLPGAPRSDRLV